MNNNKFQKAFTLIELLVVVAIIGILASVVLASLTSARAQARIAAGRQFEANVYHAEGDQIVGQWDLDDCSPSTTAADQSGLGNTGTLNGAATWSTNTQSGKGCSFSSNGSAGSFVSIASNANFRLGMGSVTISAWIYPIGNTAIPSIFVVGPNGNGATYHLGYNSTGGKIRAFFKDIISNAFSGDTTQSVADNQWTQVVMVVNRSTNLLDVYINGTVTSISKMDISSVTATVDPNSGGVVRIGADAASTAFFSGLIDNVRVFTKALTASEIEHLYAEGLKTHEFAEK